MRRVVTIFLLGHFPFSGIAPHMPIKEIYTALRGSSLINSRPAQRHELQRIIGKHSKASSGGIDSERDVMIKDLFCQQLKGFSDLAVITEGQFIEFVLRSLDIKQFVSDIAEPIVSFSILTAILL